jgi:glutamate dehydrogenase (NADP+)
MADRSARFRFGDLVDDAGKVQVNSGYRVQFNGAIGPLKGDFDSTLGQTSRS